MLMGYLVVTGVSVVSFGRLGDMFGRVRMYNLGFALFAGFSILLSITWVHGTAAAWLNLHAELPASQGRSSGSYSVACSAPSAGGLSSSSRCRSASSARSGRR
jgi:MFS family permease